MRRRSLESPFRLGVAAAGLLLIAAAAEAQQRPNLRPAQKTLKQPASQLRPNTGGNLYPNMAADGLLAPFAPGVGSLKRGSQNGEAPAGSSNSPANGSSFGTALPSFSGKGQAVYSGGGYGGLGGFGPYGPSPYGGGYPYGGGSPYGGGFGYGAYPYGGAAFPYGGGFGYGGLPYGGTPGYAGVGLMPYGPTPFGAPPGGFPYGGAYPYGPAMPYGQVPFPQAGNPSPGAPIVGY